MLFRSGADMREIIFRGKRLDNREWYYGSYLFLHISSVDWTGAKRGKPEDVHYIVNDQDINYAVSPSTVGQYTGLKDKHGKRIFENGYMIIDKQTYKVLFDNGEYILKNIFNCDTIQLKNNSNIGVFVDEI